MPKNNQAHRYIVPLIALALVMGVMGLFALACSSGSSPTEPAVPVGAEGAAASTSSLGGAPIDGAHIDIEKSTNGEDADDTPGPEIVVGDPVLWEYVITNTGSVKLTHITLNDNKIGDIKCLESSLRVGESMTCEATSKAEKGQYRNVARVRAWAPSKKEVGDKDDSHYLGIEPAGKPRIRIEKSTNGEDADSPTGPRIPVGDSVLWEYVVTNTGDVPLTDISVNDDQLGAIKCPFTTLAPGESMTCMAEGIAEEGQYKNVGRVVGTAPDKSEVADKDPSHYFGKKEEETGLEGCSHGYWKNHLGSWGPARYSPDQTLSSVFVVPTSISHLGDATLLEALRFGGGPGVEGAAKILLRQAVGALLNAAHPGVAFPMSESEVISSVNTALGSENRHTILSVKDDMDSDNNLGCPLN